ncbi:MAG: response regulator [Bradymonadales bacterium]|nr:MAG: response regulator [Bradymonadales bacterium]
MTDTAVPKRIDRYDLVDRIGSGGMGLIYKGFDTKLKRNVAIKMVSDRVKDAAVRRNIRERFFNEARAAGALSHPNLVQIYDFGEIEGVVYIVMEYIEGETLEQLLKSKGPLNIDQFLRISREVANGLSFAHKRGIVHRDIKPSNIMIEADSGVAKILDFGIAKFVDEEEMKLTSTGMVLGSTHYLSPEHITGKNLNNRSDIFCLGTVLYEAGTGTLPFRGSNSSTILYKIVNFDPPPAHHSRHDFPEKLSGVISQCMQKDPEARYQKCEDLIEALNGFEKSLITPSKEAAKSKTSGAQIYSHSYFVRDSQLLNALVTEGRLDRDLAMKYRGKSLYEALTRDAVLPEDDIAFVCSDLLNLPWIPRGRLKSLRIDPSLKDLIPTKLLKKHHFVPFFKDDSRSVLSMIIDGVSDFQALPEVDKLSQQYQLQLYVGARSVIHTLIRNRFENLDLATTTGTHEESLDSKAFGDRRVLLVEPQEHFQQAIVKLFKGFEPAITIVDNLKEARERVESEKFHHIWASRPVMGDELAFESIVIRTNPSCDLRFYDHLGEEILEDSIHYSKFRDFFARVLQEFLKKGSLEDRKVSQNFASLAVRIARVETQNQKDLDEVYFSALFYKWEKLYPNEDNLSELLFGIYRFRHIRASVGERFDGRGPMALKGRYIPLASRVIAALSVLDGIKSDLKDLSLEETQSLREKLSRFASKQLDPVIAAAILEMIRPVAEKKASKKVAIVDSDLEYSRQLQALLKGISAEATVYSDGVSALEAFQQEKPDLIVSEVVLAKLDGFALASRIRANELLKSIPLVFVSQSEQPEHSVKALQLGASDFISKTSEPQFIVTKIERYLK